jgi:hypothetical protein
MVPLSKFLPEHNKNLDRSYMVATPQKVMLKILIVLLPFQLIYNVCSMAVLANPLAWVAGKIGYASFGGLAAVFDHAFVVLVPKLCHAARLKDDATSASKIFVIVPIPLPPCPPAPLFPVFCRER